MCCVFGDISIAKKYIMKKTAESFCFVTLPSFCFRRLSAKLSSGSRRPEQPMPFAGAVLLRQRGQPVIAVEEIDRSFCNAVYKKNIHGEEVVL